MPIILSVTRHFIRENVKSTDNLDAYKLSQEILFLKLINPARKSMKEIMVKFVSDCLDKPAQEVSALASKS